MNYYYLKHTWHWLMVGMLATLSFSMMAASPTSYADFSSDSIAPAALAPVSIASYEAPIVDFSKLHDVTTHASTSTRRDINIYDLPYSTTANYPNLKRLAINTGVLYAGGIAALGILQALPEDATAWNKDRITSIPFWKRWSTHVKKGPVWDADCFIFNYILHPYGGAAYYMSARSQGCNILWSAIYSTCISTFFWEYGIEAFMEIPSLQDLIITPFAGTLIGESFYVLKRHIVANGYSLFGSNLLGNIMAFIIDPVNEVVGIFAGNPCRTSAAASRSKVSLSLSPTPRCLTLSLTF